MTDQQPLVEVVVFGVLFIGTFAVLWIYTGGRK